MPCVGSGVEESYASGVVVNAVVELYGFIPVVAAWTRVEVVVAGGLGRKLYVGFGLA